jgi:hypothetical protein
MIKSEMPRSDTLRFLSTGARHNTVLVLVVLIVGAVASWVGRSYLMPEVKKVAVSIADVRQLPSFPVTGSAPDEWDLIEGLNAEPTEGSAVNSGQRVLRLAAVGADGRHALGARFGGLTPGGLYRAIAWIQTGPEVRVMIEARDSLDRQTGKSTSYGVAQFSLGDRSVLNSTGDILASGVETAGAEWVRLWVDLRTKDGKIFVVLGLLEGVSYRHVFKATGQEMTFGGFEISPPRPVLPSLAK